MKQNYANDGTIQAACSCMNPPEGNMYRDAIHRSYMARHKSRENK